MRSRQDRLPRPEAQTATSGRQEGGKVDGTACRYRKPVGDFREADGGKVGDRLQGLETQMAISGGRERKVGGHL